MARHIACPLDSWDAPLSTDWHLCGPDGRGGGGRYIRHLHRFVDGADLVAIAPAEGFGEVGAVVGIDGRALPGATDRDIDGACVDGVGPERLQVFHDPIAQSSLAGMDGPHSPRPDMPVGEVAKVEHLARPVLALQHQARALWVDRDHPGGLPVEPIGAVVLAGELNAVAGAELQRYLCAGLGHLRAPACGLPVDGLRLVALPETLVGQQSRGVSRGVDGLDAVPDADTRALLIRLLRDNDVSRPIDGREAGPGLGEVAGP